MFKVFWLGGGPYKHSVDWSTPTQSAPPCAATGLLQYLDLSFIQVLFPSLRLNKSFFLKLNKSFFEVLWDTIEHY